MVTKKGLNLMWFFNQFAASGFFPPPATLQAIAALTFDFLRYHGGTLSNFADNARKGYGTTGESKLTYEKSYLGNYVRLLQELEKLRNNKPIYTTYVANLFQPILGMINGVKIKKPDGTTDYESVYKYWEANTLLAINAIPNIRYVELGNEFNGIPETTGQKNGEPTWYERNFQAGVFERNVQQHAEYYVTIAERLRNAIVQSEIKKKGYCNIGFGLVAGNGFNTRDRIWNTAIRSARWHDNEIHHIYPDKTSKAEVATYIAACIEGATKPVIMTEGNLQGGTDGTKNPALWKQPWAEKYFDDWMMPAFSVLGVGSGVKHYLCGKYPYAEIVTGQ